MEWNSDSLIYEAETEGLRVRVQPQFSEDQSDPETGRIPMGVHDRDTKWFRFQS